MAKIKWLPEAIADTERLYQFLAEHSPKAAAESAQAILGIVRKLRRFPKLGTPMDDERRETYVAFGAGSYVVRYRIDAEGMVVIVRVFHSREGRKNSADSRGSQFDR